jgi:hypothetical protein
MVVFKPQSIIHILSSGQLFPGLGGSALIRRTAGVLALVLSVAGIYGLYQLSQPPSEAGKLAVAGSEKAVPAPVVDENAAGIVVSSTETGPPVSEQTETYASQVPTSSVHSSRSEETQVRRSSSRAKQVQGDRFTITSAEPARPANEVPQSRAPEKIDLSVGGQ